MLPNWQSSALFLFHEKIGSRPSQRAGVCNRRTGSPELSSLKSHLAPAGPEATSTRLEMPLPALALPEPPTSPLLFDPASNFGTTILARRFGGNGTASFRFRANGAAGLLDRAWTSRHPLWSGCIFPSKDLPLHVMACGAV